MGLDDGAQGVLEGLEEHVRQMAGDVHEVQVGIAYQLNARGFKQAIVVFADEAGVLNGLLRKLFDVGLGADDADVGGVAMVALVGQGNVLADEHADADAGHVEAVEEGLDVGVDLHALAAALVFQDALGHCSDDAVVPPLDLVQALGELLVVELQLGRPVAVVVDGRKVSPRNRSGLSMAVSIAIGVAVAVAVQVEVSPARGLALVNGWIRRCLGQLCKAARAIFGRFHESFLCILGELRSR